VTSAPITLEGDELVANSFILKNHIRLLEKHEATRNGLLDIQVRALNVTRRDVQFQYRFVWLDSGGMEIDTGISIWKSLNLHAKQTGFIRGTAPSPDAVGFRLAVRFAHKSTRW